MTRPRRTLTGHTHALARHTHALVQRGHTHVRCAYGRRRPVKHGPAFRATALVSGLVMAATVLTATGSRASAAERAVPHRRPAAAEAAPVPAVLTAARHVGNPFAGPGRTAPPTPSPGTPSPGTAEPTTAPAEPDTSQTGTGADSPGGVAPGALPEGIPESRRVDHAFAADVLRANGIRWRSTGGCSDRAVRTCTSFQGIRWGTVKGLVRFARSSGCAVVVTGGTERGHADGPRSHWNGYKADIAPSPCVDRAVGRYPSAGVRGDGARLYRSPDGALFAREKDHWDITFP